MMAFVRMMGGAAAGFTALLAGTATLAQDGINDLERVGKPVPNGINFQPAVTEVARDIHFLDNMLLVIITAISLFVMALLAWVILKFNREKNPEPATFTHNSTIEVTWTVVPILILIVIGSFSLPVLFKQLEVPEPDLTVKVVGYQWYWGYEYPDEEIAFDSIMLAKDELEEFGYMPDEYLLATDTAMVVPVNAVVRVQVTAADVIHAWKIPAFGVHMDGIPGRLNETWFKAEREGLYFGQCSELCGMNHAYMPITVKVVSQEVYDQWLEQAVAQYGTGSTRVASVD